MSKRFNRAKWVLPSVVNPGTSICIQVPVPNDELHLAAFKGAIWNLCSAANWQDDLDHTAVDVANVWRGIFFELENCDMSNWTVRLDPDDCTEVQQFDNDTLDYADVFSLRCAIDTVIDEQFPPSNPPGPSQPGPQPGGGSPEPGQCWDLKIPVSQRGASLIPLQVASGWVITPTLLAGATTDGRYGPLNLWICANGNTFALGACEGASSFDSNDPLPTFQHQGVLLLMPDGTLEGLVLDTPITIPAGQPDGNYQLIVNANLVSLPPAIPPILPEGDLTIGLNICNVEWCHFVDFTTSDQSYVATVRGVYPDPRGIWVSGSGWKGNPDNPQFPGLVQIQSPTFPATATLSKVVIHFTTGAFDYQFAYPDIEGTESGNFTGDFSFAPVDTVSAWLSLRYTLEGDVEYPGYMTGVSYYGVGISPWGADNC